MLTELSIKNFRSLQDVPALTLGKINVITGQNNGGKTSLLEAVYFLLAKRNQLSLFPKVFRDAQEKPPENFRHFWLWLFKDRNPSQYPISIIAKGFDDPMVFAGGLGGPQESSAIRIWYSTPIPGQQPHPAINIQQNGNIQPTTANLAEHTTTTMLAFSPKQDTPAETAAKFTKLSVRAGVEEKLLELLKKVAPELAKLRYLKITEEPLVLCN